MIQKSSPNTNIPKPIAKPWEMTDEALRIVNRVWHFCLRCDLWYDEPYSTHVLGRDHSRG